MDRRTRFEQVSLAEVASVLRRKARKQQARVRIQRETLKHEPYHVQPREADRRMHRSDEEGVR